MKIRIVVFTFLVFAVWGSTAPAAAVPKVVPRELPITYKQLSPGIEYGTYQSTNPPMFIHVVRVDVKNPNVHVGAVYADRRASVDEMAAAATSDHYSAVAVINGDYFDESAGKGPWGPHVQDGELCFTPLRKKSAFMMGVDGTPIIDVPKVRVTATFVVGHATLEMLDLNRYDKLATPGYHLLSPHAEVKTAKVDDGVILVLEGGPLFENQDVSCGVTKIIPAKTEATIPDDGYLLCCSGNQFVLPAQMKLGVELTVKAEITPACMELVGGGPLMIKNGGTRIDFLKEEFSPSHRAYLNKGRHPRAAIGSSRDKTQIFLVIVEGRIERSKGMVVDELASVMMGLGCYEAMEFDGGGSATLFTTEGVSHTEDTEFRKVANGLGIFRVIESGGAKVEQPEAQDAVAK